MKGFIKSLELQLKRRERERERERETDQRDDHVPGKNSE